MPYEQIEPAKWPSGDERTVAVLGLEPDQLESTYGIEFTRDLDDLDYHRYVGLRLRSGRQIMLLRYERSPGSGTEVLADAADDPAAARAELLAALDLTESAVTWRPEQALQVKQAMA
jgi:hypothetical protein